AGVVRGEPEMELVRIATGAQATSTVWAEDAEIEPRAAPAVVDVKTLPALDFAGYPLELRTHRHHVFSGEGRGAEIEFSRGCPYGCSFCNRRFFRSRFRTRAVETTLSEIGALKDRGVDYVYFIDEVFGLGGANELLGALEATRPISFGCQTRLDLWDEARLVKLAGAGCVSVEFGLESPFPQQQQAINKGYHIDEERILELMVFAKALIPWVQGDLIAMPGGDPGLRERTERWRAKAIDRGVWISEPVDLFLYPGSDLHDEILGPIDDQSWDRALRASKG
ncbi:MAG TPA: radical SAM protein, partial [Chloroflexota bacterium]